VNERSVGPLHGNRPSPRRRPRCAAFLLLILVAIPVTRTVRAEPLDRAPANIVALMAHFSEAGAVRADFESTQTISILSSALESEGQLYFEPPDRMVRNTTRPGRSKVIVEGTRVAMLDETGLRRMDLARSGPARALVENIMLVLRGDLEGLKERYVVAYHVAASEGASERWTLTLTPRDRAVAALVSEIVFEGRRRQLESMLTREANGDSTRTRFTEVAFGEAISEIDRAKFFSVDAAADDAP